MATSFHQLIKIFLQPFRHLPLRTPFRLKTRLCLPWHNKLQVLEDEEALCELIKDLVFVA